jgi:sodium transport system ATP-binding protein
MVAVDKLTKTFISKKRRIEVLKGISFTAKPGEIYGLLGPNGAGKTTTLRLIATLLKPDSGTAVVNDMDVQQHPREVRDIIGFLTGDMKLSGNLSPRETLRFFGRLNHLDPGHIKERIEELSGYLGMEDFLDRPIDKLSSGLKQKTSIAVSILHDPEIIIFDEPTSNLDVLAVKVVLDFLHDVRRAGKTVILSTHILSEAERLCDTIGILLGGELIVNGNLDEILKEFGAQTLEDVFFTAAKQRGLIA